MHRRACAGVDVCSVSKEICKPGIMYSYSAEGGTRTRIRVTFEYERNCNLRNVRACALPLLSSGLLNKKTRLWHAMHTTGELLSLAYLDR